MKKLGYTTMIALATLTFVACNTNTKDAKERADSLNAAKDTSATMGEVGGIQVLAEDAEFATKAAISGLAEVELGKLAVKKASNSQIKTFANTMITDHGKASDELKEIAMSKNISLPTVLDENYQKKWDDLNTKNGKDFDKKYASLMVDEHQKDLDIMEKQAREGVDPELKAFAAKNAPILKSHLEIIKKIKNELK